MKHDLAIAPFLQNRFQLFFWAIVPFIFVSGGVATNADGPSKSRYTLKATGDFSNELSGIVDFETFLEKGVSGAVFTTVKLNFKYPHDTQRNALEFLISKPYNEIKISPGSYGIAKDINGFLNCFDGAFGFANINEFGEVPFFTTKGRITLKQVSSDDLSGKIAVYLKNAAGKTIYVSGNFDANKR
ncbi:hypothetical protein U1E44_10930 [Arenibacter sp. GZD96]|uniref:hypothetical protein n=1 Tax=Aurantibrevibacter litoralis TaxID=3106030 RepID=UPI002AFE0848|nr:hypothetical protein [Arenibacter sp. GZD-96]MEA1786607.1 hypothetical protein [Arenibacter sp. GZD-96]